MIALALLLMVNLVDAGQPSMWKGNANMPVPPGAKVTLELDRHEYFLGENVLVHFTLENTGTNPFEASFGGDYRGATRALRFQVTATDESGHMVEDPDPSGMCFGGFGAGGKLNPGEKFVQSLPLMRYCRILRPGRYTIRVAHDFGWKESKQKRPVGETTVVFRMPTPPEAEAVVAAMEKLPADSNTTFGKRSKDYADFTCLCQPIYLQPLLERAARGDNNAMEGICWIETPAATEALIGLAGNSDPKLALTAAQTLTMRLPDPTLESTNGFGGFAPFTKQVRRGLVANSWDPNLARQVRSLATNFLARSDSAEISAGAVMLQAVGTTNEASAVIAAMDRTLDPLVNPRRDPKDDILDLPDPLRELIDTMNVLHGKGYTVQEGSLSGEAQILLYFNWLAGQPTPRSDRWLDMMKAFGPDSRYPTRMAVLNSIPEPLPENCVEFVKGRLADDDLGVCRTACTIAGRSGNKIFLKPLLDIIATEQHEWLLREATDAANKLGAGFDLLNIWADRLTDEKLYGIALDSLQTVIAGLPGGSTGRTDLTRAERIELRNQWKAFLIKHADEIRLGTKFKAGDPVLSPALFGRARTWQLPNGKFWPITWEEMDRQPQNNF